MKVCELCPNNSRTVARVYCESDEASLCFECDAKVHSANFLVARHSRVLLCRCCQSPTPWRAEGRRLVPTVSLCHGCVVVPAARSKKSSDVDEGDDDDVDEGDDDDQESEEDDNEEEEDESEEGEEQVVPGTMEVSPPPLPSPPAASSSSSEEDASAMMGRNRGLLFKRKWGNVSLDLSSYSPCSTSQDQLPSSSASRPSYMHNRTAVRSSIGTVVDDEATADSFRPMKDLKRLDLSRSGSQQLSFDMMPFSSARPPI